MKTSNAPLLRTLLAAAAIGLVVGPSASGCGGDESTPLPPQPPGLLGHQPQAVPGAPSPTAPTPVAPPVERGRIAAAITDFLGSWADRERTFVDGYRASFKAQLKTIRWFRKLCSRAYEGRHYRLVFSDGEGLTRSAHELLKVLDGLESHGLDPEPYDRKELKAQVRALDDTRKGYLDLLAGVADPKEAAIWKVLDQLRGLSEVYDSTLSRMLADQDLSDADMDAFNRVNRHLDRMFTAKAGLNKAFVKADLMLLQAWFRYVYEMQMARRAHPFEADESYGKGVERTAERLYRTFEETYFSKLDPMLAELVPAIPEYALMRQGLAFYRTLAAQAEHITLPGSAQRLKKGSKGELVVKLRQRLAQEGYYQGDMGEVYDEGLAEAVRFYQETHQLKQTGAMDRSTRGSLNISFAQRAKQLELGLQRHRESDLHQRSEWRFGTSNVHARVNIPAFEATFYLAGVPARKHRIVVGANTVEVHEQTGFKGWFNRTRMFSQHMQTVVLNPKWRVPPRIKERELDRELIKDPAYYEKHNYQVKILDDGTEQVVQMPGPDNALGLVKYLFPNQFSIYMHDTPKKKLFKKPIRAFSHGCMRVDGALELARWLLVDVEGVKTSRYEKILKDRETYGIRLDKKVAVTIEYNTVGVHESGRMMFYADIYRFDKAYNAGKVPFPKHSERGLEQVVLLRR